MRIFVTGANGFTGRYLVAELQRRGHQVIAFEGDVTEGDVIRDALAAARPDRIIHLAAIAFIASDDFTAFYKVNQIGTLTLLAAVADIVPEAAILIASSANVYGISMGGYLNESTPPDPANHYAISKLAMELGARLWSDRLKITITRPFNYTGLGQGEMFLIPKIVAHFRSRAPVIRLGNMEVRRDFGDVRSVVDAYASLSIAPPPEPVVNICTGQVWSVHEILAMATRLTGHRIEGVVDPRFVRRNEVPVLAGDAGRLQKILPYWRSYTLEETLTWMLDG